MATYPTHGSANYDTSLKPYIDSRGPTVVVTGTGIDPTGATDSSAAIQALINSMDASQPGRLHFPYTPGNGYYKLTTGLTITSMNIEITGEGAPGQDTTVSTGCTRIHYTGTGSAITFNPTGPFGGPRMSQIHLTGTASATAGITLGHAHNWVFRDVSISEFTGASAWGFVSSTATGVNQYGVLDNVNINHCTNGADINANNGLKILGGSWVAAGGAGGGTPVAGSIGLQIRGGSDTTRLFGADIAGFARNVDVVNGTNHEFHGLRSENWDTASSGIRINGTNTALFGGSLNNTLSGSTGVAVEVGASAVDTFLRPASINLGTSTMPVTDAGSNTDIRWPQQTRMARRTKGTGNTTINSTTFVAVDSTNLDLTLTGCLVGDWVEVGVSLLWNNDAVSGVLDARTVVGGSPVNSVGQHPGTAFPGGGIKGWGGPSGVYAPISGSVIYQLQSGDISAGSVLIRLYAATGTATNKIIWGGSADPLLFWARNHGRA